MTTTEIISRKSSAKSRRIAAVGAIRASDRIRNRAGSLPERDGVMPAPKSPPRLTRSDVATEKGMWSECAV
jgi:hypothetical protein